MAYPSVTYTFTNGTTASATEVNQNFTDLINGLSDGTKDLSISALTVAGTASLNGAVNIGNATSDDIAVNGYITTALIPKSDDSYDLGTAALAWQDAYFDGAVYTDTISELTGAAGVTVDGVKLKDTGVDISGAGTSSGQVKFPATQNASSDVNTLDDYEEGTWSPSLAGGTITSETGTLTTVTVNVARYTKIGNMVMFNLRVTIGNAGTGGGDLLVQLPLTPANATTAAGDNNGVSLRCIIATSGNHLNVRKYDNTTAIATSAQITVQGCYFV
jgi:hypothetical protein